MLFLVILLWGQSAFEIVRAAGLPLEVSLVLFLARRPRQDGAAQAAQWTQGLGALLLSLTSVSTGRGS